MSADAPVVEFDIADPLPTGTTLLEASAGTGKTWAIAALVTRLVAEGVATLDQLLVVTFGRAASAELKDRVRERLVQADAVLAAGHGDERDPLQRLLLDVDDTERTARRRRLRAAVARFDEATITTTHGFCQAVLRSLGTTGDVEPGSVLVEDDTDIVDQVVSDLYLRAVGRGQTPPFDHQEAAVLGRRAVEDPSAHLLPTDAEPVVEMAAFEAAGDPERFPDAGEPWQPLKLYYHHSFNRPRMQALHDAMQEHGLESPWEERLKDWKPEPEWDARITTRVVCDRWFGVRDQALLAHATQIDPDGFWFAIPRELQAEVWPTEDYELVTTHVEAPTPEDDLFAGLMDHPDAAGGRI